VLAEDFQNIGKQSDSRSEQDQPNDIEWEFLFLTVVRQMQKDQNQAGNADRYVDEENVTPMQVPDNQPAGERTQRRTDQRGNRDEAHGANEFRFVERAYQREASDGNHHRSTETLEYAAEHEELNVGGKSTEKRPQGE